MKKMFLAALTVLSLSAALAPLANAQSLSHSGPYDNTSSSLNRSVVGGQ
jgi:hypothetical protein